MKRSTDWYRICIHRLPHILLQIEEAQSNLSVVWAIREAKTLNKGKSPANVLL